MTIGVPWQVIGVGRPSRETAREAARRAGMSVGDWRTLSDNFATVNDRLDNLARRLDQLAQVRLAATPPAPGDRSDEEHSARTQRERRADETARPLPAARNDPSRPNLAAPTPSSLDQALIEIAERQRALEGFVPADDRELEVSARMATQSLPRARTQELSGLEQQLREINNRIESLRQPCGINQAVDTLRDDLAEIGLMLREAMPRKALDAIEAEVGRIFERLDHTRGCVADQTVLAAIERSLAEVRDALRILTPAENLVDLARAVQALSRRIEAMESSEDPSTLQQLEDAILGVRHYLARVASNEALANLSEEVRALALKVDQAIGADGSGVLATLEQRIAMLADALEARNRSAKSAPDELETVVKRLIEKIERAPAFDAAGSEFLSRQFAELKQTERKTQDSLDSLRGTVGHLLHRVSSIESDIRNKSAPPTEMGPTAPSGPATAKAASDSVSVSTVSRPTESATPQVQSAAPTPLQQRTIDPNLPPDQPLEPGSAGSRGRNPGSPADRIAASEALLAGTKPPIVPDSDSKANFIAAARRAAQAAERVSAVKNEVAGPSEITTAAGRPAKRMTKLRALLAGTSSIVLVLTSVQVARLLLGVSEQTEVLGEPSVAIAARDEISSAGSGSLPATLPSFPLTLAGEDRGADTRVAPAADQPTQPTESLPAASLPRRLIPIEMARAATPAPPVSTAANSEITGTISAPAKPTAGAAQPSRIAPAPAAAQAASAIAAEQLPAAFGNALRAAAARGDPSAQYEVAIRYAEAHGVAQNLTEAANWFERAANQGLAPAQFRLGGLHEKGLGVKKNVEMARRYYSAAGAAGHAKALHNLAVLHAEGVDGKPDYPTAARWFRKAADYGITDSQYNLAVLHARGIGVEQNMAEAYRWFALAAREGDADAAKKRDEIATRLDSRSLAAATQAVESWKPQPQPDAAVHVRAPSEGWDVPAPDAPPATTTPSKRKPRGATRRLTLPLRRRRNRPSPSLSCAKAY